MILVDTALQARAAEGKPIRVAILGAGFMCQGLTNQIVHSTPGMRVVSILQPEGQPERSTSFNMPAIRTLPSLKINGNSTTRSAPINL